MYSSTFSQFIVKFLVVNHNCQALVITCVDFRVQEYINEWIAKNFAAKTYDRGAFAGAAKSLKTILSQIEVSHKLHHIKKVILINHEDCGAYGVLGHVDHHIRDLHQATKALKERFPDLEIQTYYLHLDGTFEKV